MASSICFPFNNALAVALPIFLLLHLSLLSARSEGFLEYCARPQFCGKLNISYPFSGNGSLFCGLEFIRCINGLTPVIYPGEENADYEIQSIDYSQKTILVHDRRFTQGLLNEDDKCNALFNNFTMPPFFRFLSAQVISKNLTLRVCKPHQELHHGSLVGPSRDCKVEALPDVPHAPASPTSPHGSLHNCKLVHLPVDVPPSTHHGPIDRASQLFTHGFRLRWNLPQQCLQCDKNGTVCLRLNNFYCGNNRKGNNTQTNIGGTGNKTQTDTVVIGIAGVAAGIIFTSLIFFTIYKYYRTGHILGVRGFSLKTDLERGSTHFGVPIFSYAELEEATNNFSSVNELGVGGFGAVYHGKLRDGRVVAIKRLYHNDYKHLERFMNEINIITRLRQQNLVTLYGCTSYHSRELLLVYEFIPNGTVADHLHGDRTKVGSLTWPIRMSIAIETASALSYLHASDVIHRDVKTSNILLDNHFHVKVADFGLCRLFPTDASHVSTAPQGTPGYVDPEYHRCYQLTDKSDVYSFGVVLIELISSKPAVDITRHRDEINLANMAMNKIQKGALQELVDPFLGFESDCTTRRMITLVGELAFRCLQNYKEMRPSMDEVLEILLATGGVEYKVDNGEVMDILASYDVELPKNTTPPPASPDSGTHKLINRSTMPNTNG